jgi:inward rectifier potassium channel
VRQAGDLYHFLISGSWPRLLGFVALGFVASNTVFALGYLAVPHSIAHAHPGSFSDAFFFSVQTMATIGYGLEAPRTLWANILVVFEALVGLVGLALVTGLAFAKFSRPTARVVFSRQAVISPHEGVPSLMFRMANARGNNIVEAQLHVVFVRNETTTEGDTMRRFYDLDLVRRRSALFRLSWTAIHPITERSPFHGASPADLEAVQAEVVVSLLGFDETFSQTIHTRYSYRSTDIVWGARFVDILRQRPDGESYVDYEHFHDLVRRPSLRGE